MAPYPSCCILDPSKRKLFLEERERCQEHLVGRYPALTIGKFEELREQFGVFDALRCAITRNPLHEAGVYVLWNRDEVVYVGRSFRSVLNRIDSHRYEKFFDEVSVLYPDTCEKWEEEFQNSKIAITESDLIFTLTPRYNKSLPCDFIEGPWWYADMGQKDELMYIQNGRYKLDVCFLSGRPYLLINPNMDGSCSSFRLTHRIPPEEALIEY